MFLDSSKLYVSLYLFYGYFGNMNRVILVGAADPGQLLKGPLPGRGGGFKARGCPHMSYTKNKRAYMP